jgi:nitric oxide reductase subunit B
VASAFKTNRYDAATDTLTLPDHRRAAFDEQVAYWTNYFVDPAKNGGLSKRVVADPDELRKLTAFFVWTAWASAAQRPGSTHSYTNNFPYDPLSVIITRVAR